MSANEKTKAGGESSPRLWVWTSLAGAAAALTTALAASQAGASAGVTTLLLAGSASSLAAAALAERRLRHTVSIDTAGGVEQAADVPFADAVWLRNISAIQNATVLLVDRQGRIDGAATAGESVEARGTLADCTNVADRPQVLMAIAHAGATPRTINAVLNQTPWFDGGRADIRIIGFDARCLVCIASSDAMAKPEEARFAARAFAHDVRAPLAVLAGMADTLAETGLATAAMREQYPGLIARAARDAIALADGWLQDVESVKTETCALEEAFHTIVERSYPAAAACGSRLYQRCPKELAQHPVDRQLTLQILSNLVGNALKHGGHGISVELSATSQRGRIELVVKDNGCGMNDAAAIRAGRSAPSPTAGHGLGLAIIERLVAPRGGRLTIESRLGGGVCVRVLLPRAAARVDDLAALAAITTRTGLPNKTIDNLPDMNGGPNGPFKRTA